jgi:serine/threonine protein kinase/Tfp pilus assembly protein PilF
MTPERWKQIDQIFHDALQRPPGDRAAFIAESCGDEECLRQEVVSLLAAHDQAASFIEVPAGDAAADFLADHNARLTSGTILNRYKILNLLGKGGMGEVYLAEDTKLSRQIALKLLPAQFTISSERMRRFEHEARAVSALNHPNIVTIHEIERLNGTNFIVTEFVDGQTLRELISERRIRLSEALDIAIQIARALDAAHTAGIVHRDIKPENIMVRRDGYVKVLDFGLAKLAGRGTAIISSEAMTKDLANTNPGLVMGTASYMSPEQALGGEVDARADIWSLGVVLYEMLIGRTPFAGETHNDVIVSILEHEPPALARSAEEVPAELERIVTRTLRGNKEKRYQTIQELALDLKALKQELEVEARLESSLTATSSDRATQSRAGEIVGAGRATGSQAVALPTSSAEYLVNEIKRHRLTAALGAAVLIVLVSTAAYFYLARRSSSGASSGETIDSLAVLPFVNSSTDGNTEYLADGLSDSIIESLSGLPNLKKVISLSSVLRYKGIQTDPQTVGRELNVRAVLIGKLAQHGDDLVISTELVDVQDNKRLWGGQYNRKLADAPKLQSEIAQEIADRLRLKLTGTEKQRLAKSSTVDPEVYRLYLVGRFYRRSRTDKGLQKGLNFLGQAINKDPNFAPAYAHLAYTYFTMGFIGLLPPKEAEQKQEAAARRALELDDMLGDAHAALALRIGHVPDWSSSLSEFQRALELDPNSADIHSYYAKALWALGRLDEAIQHQKRAEELDPLSPVMYFDLGRMFNSAHQYDQAIEQCQKALELDPNYIILHYNLALSYLALGKYEQALAEAEKTTAIKSSLGYLYAALGKKAEALKILHELQKRSKEQHVNPVAFAQIYAGLGDKDRAFEFLEKQYQETGSLNMLKTFEELKGLRSDPRFTDLLRRMNLPE